MIGCGWIALIIGAEKRVGQLKRNAEEVAV
jgi:hypothetical protein